MSPIGNTYYPNNSNNNFDGNGNFRNNGYNYYNNYTTPVQYTTSQPNPQNIGFNQSGVNFFNKGEQTQYTQQSPIQQQPQMQQTAPTNSTVPSSIGMLSGKVVDGKDIVKVTEVPFGSYAVFPRADMKEIYIKTWNSNGTTDTITYVPVIEPPEQKSTQIFAQTSESDNLVNSLIEKISSIENKLDSLISPTSPSVEKTENSKENREVVFS